MTKMNTSAGLILISQKQVWNQLKSTMKSTDKIVYVISLFLADTQGHPRDLGA